MLRKCAWCGAHLGEAGSGEGVTHTICPQCRDNLLFQNGVDISTYVAALPHPVVLVNADGEVVAGNSAACAFLGKTSKEMMGKACGQVFECAYARLPEGCGRTVHCSGCAIRRCVMRTFATGEPCERVPASLAVHQQPASLELLITTEKAGSCVMLLIEPVGQAASLRCC